MFDWTGEFNSFIVPFSPFGAPTVNRLFSPHARDFIRALAAAGGEDAGPSIPAGEPFDENALVEPRPRSGTTSTAAPATLSPATSAARSATMRPEPALPVRRRAGDPRRQVRRGLEDANVTGPVLVVRTVVTWTYEVPTPARSNCCSPSSATTTARRPTPAMTWNRPTSAATPMATGSSTPAKCGASVRPGS